MEALAVVGLVSNIIQLVDAATKAATSCYQIYKLGASIEDLDLFRTSEQLEQCFTELHNSRTQNTASPGMTGGVDLDSLSKQCCETARSLKNELKTIQTHAGGSRREAVRKYVLRKRKASEIERLKERLDGYQRALDTKILVNVRQMLTTLTSQQVDQNGLVEREIANMTTKLAFCQIAAADSMKTALDRAIGANKLEHENTRNHIISHVDKSLQRLDTDWQEQQDLRKCQDRLLSSLRFDESNLRRNDIVESSSRTFGWAFKGETSRSWASLGKWLEHGRQIYWVQGKAGAGKSTFMKFLVNDDRTSDLLESWSGDKGCIILDHYFWLSGSKLQRSIKGFLACILSQIMDKDFALLNDALSIDGRMKAKKSISDWSVRELKDCVSSTVEALHHKTNICAFLDGIDEFDQEEDVGDLLDFLETLCRRRRTKVCISSRPEPYIERRLSIYDQLRLQDLTTGDMRNHIHETLLLALDKSFSMDVVKDQFDYLIRLMIEKADGVFLWVHFAMKSLVQGIRNEDDLNELKGRLEDLPSGMGDLYQKMWLRLNEDEERYRHEARNFFSFHEHFPLSLFEMMVASREDIQRKYIEDLVRQDPTEMARCCNSLKTRIMTRCAGLLEVRLGISDVISSWNDDESVGSASLDNSTNQDNLKNWHRMKVTFLHRTAKDFLFNSEAGRVIAGGALESRETKFERVMKARMATLIQGLTNDLEGSVHQIMKEISIFDTEAEAGLLNSLRQVSKVCNAADSRFIGEKFASYAAFWQFSRYLQYFIAQEKYVSPYFKGHLLSEAISQRPLYRNSTLISWLIQNGADLSTKNLDTKCRVLEPRAKIFEFILNHMSHPQHFDYILECDQLPRFRSGDHCILKVYGTDSMHRNTRYDVGLYIEAEVDSLSHWIMWCLAQRKATAETTGTLRFQPNFSMRVLSLMDFRDSRNKLCLLNHEDSVYIGNLYKTSLLQEGSLAAYESKPFQTQESTSSQVDMIIERSQLVDQTEWELDMGIMVYEDKVAPFLDPAEDVDESNWQEKGWFREFDRDNWRNR